ncbi:hypothetical protein HR15_03415 [Porphyromonas gulae]|uniref:Uncharacterized protein n=1 Tax=Porphyromonas gulae TaxID=111105 RepID=A0A0A2FQH3_9PORP|nr:hypothetical protein HR15_03415 [Porphyromonas gulae]
MARDFFRFGARIEKKWNHDGIFLALEIQNLRTAINRIVVRLLQIGHSIGIHKDCEIRMTWYEINGIRRA